MIAAYSVKDQKEYGHKYIAKNEIISNTASSLFLCEMIAKQERTKNYITKPRQNRYIDYPTLVHMCY